MKQDPLKQEEIRDCEASPVGLEIEFTATVRIDTPVEVENYRNGGILHTVLRELVKEA